MTDTFTLRVEYTPSTLAVIATTGAIDIVSARTLRAQGLELIAQAHPHLILDLSGVTFCDSSGLNALIGILRCAKDAGGSLVLAGAPARLTRMLELTGISALLPAYPNADEALNAHNTTNDIAEPA